jgi:stage V sporulation protein S
MGWVDNVAYGDNVVPIGVIVQLRVAASTKTNGIAGAIAHMVRESGTAELQAIGAAAVSQAVKGAAVARLYLAEEGIDLICIPEFAEVMIDGEERTAIRLRVEKRLETVAAPAATTEHA